VNSCAMSDTPSVGTLTHFANHGNIKSVPRHIPVQFEFPRNFD